ncbi:hypothetical protein HGRIS_007737 [Hohenbuehelia grisea]|uniref:Alginate lyase domain-containing protein n=1 Tax=Hohenbuehelia grisea TaxID=104357 RepID=A0ABR3J5T1_9AGAR
MLSSKLTPIAFLALAATASADGLDWISVNYIAQQSRVSPSTRAATRDSQMSIIRNAEAMGRHDPWTIINSPDILPPSGDPRDYLSWAPYHWPDCNWCGSSGRQHLAHGNGTDEGPDDDADDDREYASRPDYYSDSFFGLDLIDSSRPEVNKPSLVPRSHRRMTRAKRLLNPLQQISEVIRIVEDVEVLPPDLQAQAVSDGMPNVVTKVIGSLGSVPTPTSTAHHRTSTGTPGPALAPAKTQKAKGACTPSPTKSLAPSATWTTCPYVVRDGQVNPDVRSINGPGAIQSAGQAILYNGIAYAITGSSSYASNVAKFVYAFFLDPDTGMNPNINYGQIVRGPGPKGQQGTFTGILDLRSTVKVVNAMTVLRVLESPQWTTDLDQAMSNWMSEYTNWLVSSAIGQDTATRPNNHGSYYYSQLASARIFAGDPSGAANVLQYYFTHQFLDQIAASGEQPFEAVRTRPYHYRCFNLEAMIANAKLGDQVGLDLWSAKSKYGATIQTAVDFLMRTNPKNEVQAEVLPHVAAVAAAYGDPTGKYAAFMRKLRPDYQRQPFWFYDQGAALPNSPASRRNTKRGTIAVDRAPLVAFECPPIFHNTKSVALDNGVFVTCEELRPFF